MSKPIVAIVGRPNVGKSTLFNVLAGEKISIVQDTPGVTRDRIYADINWLDYNFTLTDVVRRQRGCRTATLYRNDDQKYLESYITEGDNPVWEVKPSIAVS